MAESCEDKLEAPLHGLCDRHVDVARQLAALTEEMHGLRRQHLVLKHLIGADDDCGVPVLVHALWSGSVTSRVRCASPPPPSAPPPSLASSGAGRAVAPTKTRSQGSEQLTLARERARRRSIDHHTTQASGHAGPCPVRFPGALRVLRTTRSGGTAVARTEVPLWFGRLRRHTPPPRTSPGLLRLPPPVLCIVLHTHPPASVPVKFAVRPLEGVRLRSRKLRRL